MAGSLFRRRSGGAAPRRDARTVTSGRAERSGLARRTVAVVVSGCALLSGCTGTAFEIAADEPAPLQLWTHGGTDAERGVLDDTVAQWERTSGMDVEIRHIPEGDYPTELQAAAAAGELPDLLDVDGPQVVNLAYRGDLAELDALLPTDVREDLLPSLREQGSYRGHLYSAGTFDSGLGLFADASRLRQVGARIPTGPQDAWTAQEFGQVLRDLAATDPDGKVLDLKLSYGMGEWYTYAFSPLLSSAGTAILDPQTGRAQGTLDSPEAIAAIGELVTWRSFAVTEDQDAFTDRELAISWVGHWEYERYRAALGEDLVLVPLPAFAAGTRSGMGSWAWAIPATSTRPDEAAELLTELLEPHNVRAMTEANGAVPGRLSVLKESPEYQPGGDLVLYAEQLSRACPTALSTDCVAVPRPATPAYPVVTAEFALAISQAFDQTNPVDPASALSQAAHRIDADAEANDYYASP
ncbi:MAG: extracellular solute-binding protein [Actinomycetales bacterium]